jgi:branched-chain amino acid transport system ATP-binding protein
VIALEHVSVRYGAVEAVTDARLRCDAGEAVAVLGANGAGKTTLLRAISGLEPLSGGDVRVDGESVRGMAPEDIVRRGVSHVPEGRRVLGQLTVRENLELATAPWRQRGSSITAELERVHELFPVLAERAKQQSYSLSGGEQQMLAIGRALMARPRVILLDEPTVGLAPVIVTALFQQLAVVLQAGVSLLLVEQNAKAALKLVSRAYVLERGRVIIEGSADEVRRDPRVQSAYLGGGDSLTGSELALPVKSTSNRQTKE